MGGHRHQVAMGTGEEITALSLTSASLETCPAKTEWRVGKCPGKCEINREPQVPQRRERRFAGSPRYQPVSGITAGQRLANCCWRAFGVSGVVCTLTKSLTTDVSGVPQSLSLDGRIGTRERNQDDPGDVRRRSSGRSPGGRRRVRPARRLARDRFMASPHILRRPRSTANTPRRLAKDHAVVSSRSDRQVTRYLLGSYRWYRTTRR